MRLKKWHLVLQGKEQKVGMAYEYPQDRSILVVQYSSYENLDSNWRERFELLQKENAELKKQRNKWIAQSFAGLRDNHITIARAIEQADYDIGGPRGEEKD